MFRLKIILTVIVAAVISFNFATGNKSNNRIITKSSPKGDLNKLDTAILGGGCFWCIEAILNDLKGVKSVESGYTGGKTKNPTYQEVCTGNTGHAEVVKIVFDQDIISFEKILEIFFYIHDPTTLNRQGNDIGTQYRSAIFYNSPEQKKTAESVIAKTTAEGLWDDAIVTEVSELDVYYPAENYHQDYYDNNKEKPYCSMVIAPKIAKFYEKYGDLVK